MNLLLNYKDVKKFIKNFEKSICILAVFQIE